MKEKGDSRHPHRLRLVHADFVGLKEYIQIFDCNASYENGRAVASEIRTQNPVQRLRSRLKNLIVPGLDFGTIAALSRVNYIGPMSNLTRQQQLFLCVVLLLLLTGWAVKAWRTAHPPAPATAPAVP